MFLLFMVVVIIVGVVDLDCEGCDLVYVEFIVKCLQKIVDKLELIDIVVVCEVIIIIVNCYFKLNDIYEMCDVKVKLVKEILMGDVK